MHVATHMPHVTEYWNAICISSSIHFCALMQGLIDFFEPLLVNRCKVVVYTELAPSLVILISGRSQRTPTCMA